MKLIPNNITVSEQFVIRNRLEERIRHWVQRTYNTNNFVHTKETLARMERETGVRCHVVRDVDGGPIAWHKQTLGGYTMTDEKKYMWFMLGGSDENF